MATRWQVTKAVRASDLPAPSRLIMLTLADVAEVGTAEIPARFTPSLTVLSRETALAKSTVKAHLAELEKVGWIVRTRPDAKAQWHGERTRYRLDLPEGVGQDAAYLGREVAQGGPTDGPGVGQEVAQPRPGDGHLETDHSDLGLISSDHFVSATPPKASKTTRRVTDDDSDFAAFWTSYPRKTGKGHARTAWASALKTAEPAAIISGAEKFAGWCSRSRTEQRFIPHPATWLRGERWSDEAETDRQPARSGYRPFTNPTDDDAYGGTL